MPIRWKNTLVRPITTERWLQWVCRYPAIFLLPMLGMLVYAGYFWHWLSDFETGVRPSIYLGSLRVVYELLGKAGISGLFVLLAVGFAHLFWYYAVREPKK